jgi:hypothetical protein
MALFPHSPLDVFEDPFFHHGKSLSVVKMPALLCRFSLSLKVDCLKLLWLLQASNHVSGWDSCPAISAAIASFLAVACTTCRPATAVHGPSLARPLAIWPKTRRTCTSAKMASRRASMSTIFSHLKLRWRPSTTPSSSRESMRSATTHTDRFSATSSASIDCLRSTTWPHCSRHCHRMEFWPSKLRHQLRSRAENVTSRSLTQTFQLTWASRKTSLTMKARTASEPKASQPSLSFISTTSATLSGIYLHRNLFVFMVLFVLWSVFLPFPP